MSILMLKNVQIAFPALAEPQAIGEGEPAYGGRFVIDPKNTAQVAEIEAAIAAVAKAKWKDDAEAVLAMLKEDKKVAFERRPYVSKKTGKPYAGFEDKFNLGTRTPANKPRPSVFDEFGKPLVAEGKLLATKSEVEQTVYSGAATNAKVEFWAQDNSFGRRINCSLLGVMYAGHGESFGGGSAPASADDFSGLAKSVGDADGVL